ncbi:MAG: hypothetical protein ACK4S4_11330 [Pyrinomonadaceae bacterium]
MKGIFTILGGLGVGAALMYFFDPQEGSRRRALVKDKATSINDRAQDAISGRVQDVTNRAKGLLHEAGLKGSATRDVSEQRTIQ